MENSAVIQLAERKDAWEEFLAYKIKKQHLSPKEEAELRTFIGKQAYLVYCDNWKKNRYPLQLPVKKVINKEGTEKKRVVYSFEGEEGIFLKFIAYHLFTFDDVFCENCYAFRRGVSVGDAIRNLKSAKVDEKYCLKADISNYFNSIDVKRLLEKLIFIKEKDAMLYQLFEKILLEERVTENGKVVREKHGAMAGTAISPFLANVYLSDTDHFFHEKGILYFRYSDDILLFADSLEELREYERLLYERLSAHGLFINPEKVRVYEPFEKIDFLGFSYQNGEIDLSENTLRKIKAKIRRKARALVRWRKKKGLSGEKAAIGFIRAMNRKFYGRDEESAEDFSWKRWFFPNLTVDGGLKEIDAYMQQYIRFTVTGRHYKGNYRISYEDMKNWGYRSLVNEYYKGKSKSRKQENIESK